MSSAPGQLGQSNGFHLWHTHQSATKALSQTMLLWATWYCLGNGKVLGKVLGKVSRNRYIIHVTSIRNATCFIMNIPPDPVMIPLALCIGRSGHACGQPMGPLHVYQGKGDASRKHMQGALVQTVCSFCL